MPEHRLHFAIVVIQFDESIRCRVHIWRDTLDSSVRAVQREALMLIRSLSF